MIIPEKLKKGDTVAIVSLSSGMGGEKEFLHRYEIGKQRLEKIFGLKVITMPNALKGCDYLDKHPEARASDLMDAFKDRNIKGIFTMIGGDDSIRIVPFIDYDVIKNNPKIFTGFSDTTFNHFMLNKLGLSTFYGHSFLVDICELDNDMLPYTENIFFYILIIISVMK